MTANFIYMVLVVLFVSLINCSENSVFLDKIQSFKGPNFHSVNDGSPCIWLWWRPRHRKTTSSTTTTSTIPVAKVSDEIPPVVEVDVAASIATTIVSVETTVEVASDVNNDAEDITTEAQDVEETITQSVQNSEPVKLEESSSKNDTENGEVDIANN